MRNTALDLSKVDDIVEARIRFHLLEKVQPSKTVETEKQGSALVEAGIVLLSAALQAFVEEVFLECSEKALGKELRGSELKAYRKTFKLWGNPNPNNIKALFRRLAVIDVFDKLNVQLAGNDDPCQFLEKLNRARNCIAHGNPVTYQDETIKLNLSLLREWRENVDSFSRTFRFHALHSCGIRVSP